VKDTSEWTGSVHVVTNLQSIAPRYVFLLPDTKYTNLKTDYKAPERAAVKGAMVEAFKFVPIEKGAKFSPGKEAGQGTSYNTAERKAG
jgi:hypothetical protein